jgi:fructose/tagatose bisphosphate aldolase
LEPSMACIMVNPILEKINANVDIPLVLHGGSGTPEDILKKCIAGGIAKINVNTEISLRVMETIQNNLLLCPVKGTVLVTFFVTRTVPLTYISFK